MNPKDIYYDHQNYPYAINYENNLNQLRQMEPEPLTIQYGHSKSVYINQNFNNGSKVLINPNFKGSVHINPNFNAPQNHTKPSIYINPNHPNVLKQDTLLQNNYNSTFQEHNYQNISITINNLDYVKPSVVRHVVVNKVRNMQQLVKPIISTKNKLVRVHTTKQSVPKPIMNKINKKILSKYKFVRNNVITKHIVQSPVRKRKSSIHTTYKIVRKHTSDQKTSVISPKKNKFKIDRRNSIIKSKHKSYLVNIDLNHQIIKNNGLLKLNNSLKSNIFKKFSNMNSSKVIKIRGNLFKMEADRKTMRLLNKNPNKFEKTKLQQIIIGGYVYQQKETNIFVMTRRVVRQIRKTNMRKGNVYKIDRTEENAKKRLRKNNLPCQIFRKTGRCLGFKKGTCIHIHNTNQINLCTRFLQGACMKKKCLMSHKVSLEKMPTCKFYLEGLCHKEDCQYLHVKINPKSDICKDFLQGYCQKAAECDKRHQYLCPDYEKNGSCPKKMCAYPHGDVVRQYTSKILNKIARNNAVKVVKTNVKKIKKSEVKIDPIPTVLKTRYYAGDAELIDAQIPSCGKSECPPEINGDSHVHSLLNRPRLGSLPMFIPFD